MTAPRLSVVMGVFNGEGYLEEALAGIGRQTEADFEFLIVDDGSTDRTPAILVSAASRDGRIRVLRQPNAGLTRALIRGCAEARGDLIARQDADDVSLPARLSRQADLLERDGRLGFVSCWAEWIGPRGEPLQVIARPADPDEATRGLLRERLGPPAHGTVMFRRDLYRQVGGYRPEFYYAQDSDLWLRMGTAARIGYVPEILYRYRFWPGNISAAKRNLQQAFGDLGQACHSARRRGEPETPFLEAAARLSESARSADSTSGGAVRRAEGDSLYFIGRCLLKRGCAAEARPYLRRAVHARPSNGRAWLAWLAASLRLPAGRGTASS